MSSPISDPSVLQPPQDVRPGGKYAFVVIAFALAAIVTLWLYLGQVVVREQALMCGIFVLAAVLWVTEAIPLFATSLLVVGLEILLLANPGNWPGLGFDSGDSPNFRTFVAAAADPVIMLFFGGFLLARAAVKEGVDATLAGIILRWVGRRPGRVLAGVMLVTVMFSMWMSNTATAAMMMALVAPMLAMVPKADPFRKALLLGVAFSANIGGMGTPIGSPPNAVAMGFLRNAGLDVGFLQWMLVSVPLLTGLLVFCWVLLMVLYAPRDTTLRLELKPRRLTRRGWFVVGVFLVTAALWLTESLHHLPSSVVALLPAVVFSCTHLLGRQDVNSMEWSILILIAGGISLGKGMQVTGLDESFVHWMLTDRESAGLGVLGVLVMITLGLGTFMSNTAAANLLLPIGISLAIASGGGLGQVHVAISIALMASVGMALPISTPPNAVVYAYGDLKTRDMAITGGIIGLLCAVLVTFGSGMVLRFWGVEG